MMVFISSVVVYLQASADDSKEDELRHYNTRAPSVDDRWLLGY
jgi:hypothetical protein